MKAKIALLLTMLFPLMAWGAEYKLVLPDLKGKVHSLADYQGKWVVINYWATWCPPCLDEIPELVEFHEKHSKKDAVVLGVSYEEVDRDYLKSFVDEYFISYPILQGDLNRAPPFGRIYGLPTTYVVSPSGKLIDTRVGGVTRQYLEAIIKDYPKHGLKSVSNK